ncbi:HD domain-containing phosphohydrolase [Magnetovibrio sp. PR-2]|uniref:HD-GYP domain-containing protein n=1 Tax=Magnetovibrio sp. PR-2 TaxID=3120356 RepID=UPI002FCE1086
MALAGLVLSIVFGGTELYREVLIMEEQATSFATQEANEFAEIHSGSLTHETIQEDLEIFIGARSRAPNGHLVAVKILSSSVAVLADANDGSDTTHVAMQRHSLGMSMRSAPEHDVFWDDKVYVRVIVPLALQGEEQPAVFSGLFLVDPEVVSSMKQEIAKTVGITVLIVFLTALFLYPLVLYLDRNLRKRTRQLLEANSSMLEALGSAIAKRDSDTGAHNYRVAYYSIKLGEAFGLSRKEIVGLMKGAFLHDIGKIGVPDAILLKPGKLTDEEFVEMQTHVQHGLDIVKDVKWFNDAAEVIGGHHEKWNGNGYPAGLAGDDIPLSARIFAIADVFDALTSRRPYKEPFSIEKATNILEEGRGQHFDPELLSIFLERCDEWFAKITAQDDAALKKTLMSCTCHYMDSVV